MTETQARYEQIAPLALAIRTALLAELGKLGFAPGTVTIADPASATYRLEWDRASDAHGLIGEWRDPQGRKQGELAFHADGSFFVEYDVIRTHPRDERWFVEAVNAWGRDADIRAEPRLLRVPE
jgi:YD repeat-containing protein